MRSESPPAKEPQSGRVSFDEAHDASEETLELEAHEYLAGGNRVVVLGHFRAAAIPTKREWSMDFVHELVIQDGRIAIFRSYFDTAAAVWAHTP